MPCDYEIWPVEGLAVVRLSGATSMHQLVACAFKLTFDADFPRLRTGLVDVGEGPLPITVSEVHRLGESILELKGCPRSNWAVLTRHPHDTAIAMLLQRQIVASRPFKILSSDEGADGFLWNNQIPPTLARRITGVAPTTGTQGHSALLARSNL